MLESRKTFMYIEMFFIGFRKQLFKLLLEMALFKFVPPITRKKEEEKNIC